MKRQGVAILLFFLPIMFSVFFVYHLGVDVPWGDQWDVLPPLLEKIENHTLSAGDLLAPHGEHRIAFPRLIMLGLAQLTAWNTRAEMMLIQGMMLFILCLLAYELHRGLGRGCGWWPLVPLSFLLFNLKQWETMLFGVQITYILSILAAITALKLLSGIGVGNYSWLRMTLALLSALIASFSILAGLLVWPAALIVLLIGGPRSRRLLPLWLVMGIATWVYYLIGLQGTQAPSHYTQIMAQPQAFTRFILGLLGNAFIARHAMALIAGVGVSVLILVCLAMLIGWRRLAENRFWIGVLSFALFSLASVAVGRFSLGLDAAFAPRYTTFSLLVLVALYAMFMEISQSAGGLHLPRGAVILLLAAILVSLPISYHRGWIHGSLLHDKQVKMAELLRDVDARSDEELKLIHPRPAESLRPRVLVLKKLGYSVFRPVK